MRNRTRALSVLIAVLLVGALLGVAGLRLWEKRAQGDLRFLDPIREHGRSNRFVERLQLTPEQQAQLKTILEDSRRQINAGRAEMAQRMDAIRSATNAKIAAILNDEQKKKFEQFLREAGSRHGSAGRRGDRGGHVPEH